MHNWEFELKRIYGVIIIITILQKIDSQRYTVSSKASKCVNSSQTHNRISWDFLLVKIFFLPLFH